MNLADYQSSCFVLRRRKMSSIDLAALNPPAGVVATDRLKFHLESAYLAQMLVCRHRNRILWESDLVLTLPSPRTPGDQASMRQTLLKRRCFSEVGHWRPFVCCKRTILDPIVFIAARVAIPV